MQAVVSVVVPCFDEAAVLPALIGALNGLGRRLEEEMACGLEIVLVDDGSRDGTWGRIETLAAERDDVRGVRLSRNFGQQAAMTCGYATATGDAVVCLDADLQDPPELIVEMVRRWRAGADVVFAVRRSRSGETWFKRATAAGFYRVIRAMGAAHVRADTGDFRLLSRRAVDALLTQSEEPGDAMGGPPHRAGPGGGTGVCACPARRTGCLGRQTVADRLHDVFPAAVVRTAAVGGLLDMVPLGCAVLKQLRELGLRQTGVFEVAHFCAVASPPTPRRWSQVWEPSEGSRKTPLVRDLARISHQGERTKVPPAT
jgi:hypothetical protein